MYVDLVDMQDGMASMYELLHNGLYRHYTQVIENLHASLHEANERADKAAAALKAKDEGGPQG